MQQNTILYKVSHHVTLGFGEPKLSHSNKAFWPSANLYANPSSVRICGGSSETEN